MKRKNVEHTLQLFWMLPTIAGIVFFWFIYNGACSISNWLIDWSLDWLIDRSIDRSIDWLIVRSIDWLIARLIDWLIGFFICINFDNIPRRFRWSWTSVVPFPCTFSSSRRSSRPSTATSPTAFPKKLWRSTTKSAPMITKSPTVMSREALQAFILKYDPCVEDLATLPEGSREKVVFGPDDPDVISQQLFYLLADYYLKNTDHKRAIRLYTTDLSINPRRMDSWAGLAMSKSLEVEKNLTSVSCWFIDRWACLWIDWLINWLIVRLVDWLIDWLIDRLIDWLAGIFLVQNETIAAALRRGDGCDQMSLYCRENCPGFGEIVHWDRLETLRAAIVSQPATEAGTVSWRNFLLPKNTLRLCLLNCLARDCQLDWKTFFPSESAVPAEAKRKGGPPKG